MRMVLSGVGVPGERVSEVMMPLGHGEWMSEEERFLQVVQPPCICPSCFDEQGLPRPAAASTAFCARHVAAMWATYQPRAEQST